MTTRTNRSALENIAKALLALKTPEAVNAARKIEHALIAEDNARDALTSASIAVDSAGIQGFALLRRGPEPMVQCKRQGCLVAFGVKPHASGYCSRECAVADGGQ